MRNKGKKTYLNFLVLWLGQFLSAIGSGLTSFSLAVYIFQQTQSITSFTTVLLCIFLPALLIKPFGGILADRFDRRSMMLIGDFGASLGTVFILLAMIFGLAGFWYIYLGIIVSSIFGSIQDPAYKASVTDLLSKDQYAKASGLMQLAHSAQYLISPFLAGLILFYFSIKLIFIIDIVTFLFAIATIIWVRKNTKNVKLKSAKQNFVKDFTEGFAEFTRYKGIVYLVAVTTIVLFFVGLLQALFVPMLLFLVDIKITGTIQSLSALGMLIGSLFLGIFGSKTSNVKMLATSLFFAGIFFSLIGIFTNTVFITLAGFLFFAFLPFVNTSIEVLIRKKIDNKKQGRIWSIISVITYAGSIFAFFVAGFLVDKVSGSLLMHNNGFTRAVELIIGKGEGREIGLMFLVSGLLISVTALFILKNKSINKLESRSLRLEKRIKMAI